MSWSTNEKIPSVPVPVSIDACLELERRINQFRLNVFRRAAGMSKPIRNANVNRALWEIVECRQVDENVNMNPDQEVSAIDVPDETYRLLEQRLHSLRVAVIHRAHAFAARSQDTEVSPETLIVAWDEVLHSVLLESLLQLERDPEDIQLNAESVH